jgi:hypothetical protein
MAINQIFVDYRNLAVKSGYILRRVPSLMVEQLKGDGLVLMRIAAAIGSIHRESELCLWNVQ